MLVEGMKRKLVMLSEIDYGETFTFPKNTHSVFVKTTGRDRQPSLTEWYTCVSLTTGDLFSFPETEEVVKCKAKVVVE